MAGPCGEDHAHSQDGHSHPATGGEAADHDKSDRPPHQPAECDEGECSYLPSDAVVFLAAPSLAADTCVIAAEALSETAPNGWVRDQGAPLASTSALKVRALLQSWRL